MELSSTRHHELLLTHFKSGARNQRYLQRLGRESLWSTALSGGNRGSNPLGDANQINVLG